MGLDNSWVTAMLVVAMLISGTANTIATKFQNDTCANTQNGRYVKYTHPWVQTLVMFAGEFTCLGMFLIRRRFYPSQSSDPQERSLESPIKFSESSPLINDGLDGHKRTTAKDNEKVFSWIFAMPAGLDLFGTTVASVALLFIPSSVWQLLRGSLTVFVGVLSVIFLKRRLKMYNWVGMFFVVLGLVCVGVSVLVNPSDDDDASSASSGELALGVILVLVGQMISAIQFIVEESLLSKRDCDPLQVVGMEGFFGLILTGIVLIPCYYVPEDPVLPNCGSNVKVDSSTINAVFHDNALDAFYQMYDPMIATTTVMCFLGIAIYNFTGLFLTKRLSAVHRTLIDACRSLSVWVVNIVVYYGITAQYGEPWRDLSFAELGGFVLLVFGTLMYNAIIRFPFFDYSEEDAKEKVLAVAPEGDERSPMIAGSPRFTFKGKNKNDKQRRRKLF